MRNSPSRPVPVVRPPGRLHGLGTLAATTAMLFAVAGSSALAQGGGQIAPVAATRAGVIESLWIDFPGRAQRRDFLSTEHGRIELRYERPPARTLSGAHVTVRGVLTGEVMALDPAQITALDVAAGDADALPLPNVFGAQRLLVIPVNFLLAPEEPWTRSEIDGRIFGDAQAWYQGLSLGRTSFAGTVSPWVTIDHDPADCDIWQIAALADVAAAAQGFDPAASDRIIYVVPGASCGWAGLATAGPYLPSRAWLKSIGFDIVVHELGHNFGLQHSRGSVCPAGGAWPADCATYEYGDMFDVMGNARSAPFNAMQQRRLGFLDTDPQLYTVEVAASGLYTLGAYAALDGEARALRIAAGTDAETGAARTLYVTLRQPVGQDSGLASVIDADQNRIANGIEINIGLEATGSGALIDATPYTADGVVDLKDAAFLVGEAWVDPVSGITIAPMTVEPGRATVQITLGTGPTAPPATTNSTPVAMDDSATDTAGSSIEIPVLANDYDLDGDTLVVTSLGTPLYGTVSLDSAGQPVYRAPRRFTGTDTFDYAISDGYATASARVTVMVQSKPGKGRGR